MRPAGIPLPLVGSTLSQRHPGEQSRVATWNSSTLVAVDPGDVAGALAMFSANSIYYGEGCVPDPCVGPSAIERQIVRSIADDTHTTLRAADIQEYQVSWSGDVVSDAVLAAGFDHVAVMGSARIDGNTIAEYRVWLDTTDPRTAL